MSALELKEQIIKELDNANEGLLHEIYSILHTKDQESDWDNLPAHVRENIEIGIEQANNGYVIPHEEVMAKIDYPY